MNQKVKLIMLGLAEGATFVNVKKNKKGLIIKLAIALCVVVMIVSGAFLLMDWLDEKKSIDTYTDLEKYIAPPPETQDTAPPETPTDVPPRPTETEDTAEPESSEPPTGVPEETGSSSGRNDNVSRPAPDYWPVVDFDGLREINGDIVAWIISPGTNVNYPVVQGADNDYYLTHLFTGESSKAGAIFMDYRNRSDFTHRNTVIFGHHLRNQTMFWTLTQYKSQSYFNNHPSVRLITPSGRYELQIVASYVASVDDDAWRIGFGDSETFLAWVDASRAKSDVTSSVEVTENDRVVTLSTCTYEFSNARYIVLGKLVAVE